MRVVKFTVDVAQEDAGDAQQHNHLARDRHAQRDQESAHYQQQEDNGDDNAESEPPTSVIGQRNLNVVI